MNRLIEYTVRSGLVIAWRFATCPTSRSPSFVNATTDGVRRLPSSLVMTLGSRPSMIATTLLVVPRAMPIVLATLYPPETTLEFRIYERLSYPPRPRCQTRRQLPTCPSVCPRSQGSSHQMHKQLRSTATSLLHLVESGSDPHDARTGDRCSSRNYHGVRKWPGMCSGFVSAAPRKPRAHPRSRRMLVHQDRTAVPGFIPSVAPSPEQRVAVVVNANARQVTPKVIRALSHVVAEDDFFVSHSQLQMGRIAKTLLERQYQVVFCGGGDGTFVTVVNEVFQRLERGGAKTPRRSPRFGILKLGTGNGLASLVHASPARGERMLEDVLRAKAGGVPGGGRLGLLLVEGQRTPFAGLGVDGKLLNDYVWVRNHLAQSALEGLVSGSGGYFSAVALKTLPHYLTHSTSVECEVMNGLASPAYRLAPDGSLLGEPIAPGGPSFRRGLVG